MKDKKKYEEDVSMIFMAWTMGELKGDFSPVIPNVHEESFICQVLSKRMEAFGLQVVVPDHLSCILEICTEGNPGLSLYMLSEILKNTHIQCLPYTIKAMDFTMTFPTAFPVLTENRYAEYQKKWDGQKYEKDGHLLNRVDTPDFWKEVIGRSLYE